MKYASPFVLLLFILLLSPRPAAAQPDFGGITQIYVAAGVSQPVSPVGFNQHWKVGNHMTAGVGFDGADVFTLRMGLRYNSFLLDTTSLASALGIKEVSMPENRRYYLIGATFDLLLDAPSPLEHLTPYLLVGITLYYTTLNDMAMKKEFSLAQVAPVRDFAPAMNVGLGLSHTLTQDLQLYMQYMLIGGFAAGDEKAFTPFSVGLAVHI